MENDNVVLDINFYADESGQLHSNSRKRFFVIGGYFCLKDKSQLIKNRYIRTLKRMKIKRGMSKVEELKTREMTVEEKIKLISTLQDTDGFNGFAIVIDKDKMYRKIDKESIFYNYFIRLIIKEVLVKKIDCHFPNVDVVVNMRLDSRNVSVGHLRSLEDYLNSEYAMDRYYFNATYVDSKTDYCIQATDLIANTIYMSFKDPSIVKDVMPYVNLDKIYVIVFPDFKRLIKAK